MCIPLSQRTLLLLILGTAPIHNQVLVSNGAILNLIKTGIIRLRDTKAPNSSRLKQYSLEDYLKMAFFFLEKPSPAKPSPSNAKLVGSGTVAVGLKLKVSIIK